VDRTWFRQLELFDEPHQRSCLLARRADAEIMRRFTPFPLAARPNMPATLDGLMQRIARARPERRARG
jgi:hypothetical protein